MRTVAASIATAGLALLVAGCGGSKGSRPAQGSPSSQVLAFAQCMRSHGVPNWPDPTSGGVFDKSRLTSQQLGATDAQVQAAQTGCRRLLPNGGNGPGTAQMQQSKAQALRFSECVRNHGVSNFPDPDSTGRIPDPAAVGIDQGSPKFEAANRACGKYRPPYFPSNAAYNSWAQAHPGGS